MENSNDDDNCSSPVSLGATDWSEAAVSTAHIFVPTGGSVQACYLGMAFISYLARYLSYDRYSHVSFFNS